MKCHTTGFISQNKAIASLKKQYVLCGIVFTTVLILEELTAISKHLFATAMHAFIIMSPTVHIWIWSSQM